MITTAIIYNIGRGLAFNVLYYGVREEDNQFEFFFIIIVIPL